MYPGLHPAIVDEALFEAVQAVIADNQVARVRAAPTPRAALLTGKIFDGAGHRMSPTFSIGKAGTHHRYYVSTLLNTGRAAALPPGVLGRVPARVIEALVMVRCDAVMPAATGSSPSTPSSIDLVERIDAERHLVRIALRLPGDIQLGSTRADAILERLKSMGDDVQVEGGLLRITASADFQIRGGRTSILAPENPSQTGRAHHDPVLVGALKRAHAKLRELGASPNLRPLALRKAGAPDNPYHKRLVGLAMLAPDIQEAILNGRQPRALSLKAIMEAEIPLTWTDQRAKLGFPPV